MKPARAIRLGMAAVVLILLLASCLHPSPPSHKSNLATSENGSSPQIEPTAGLESPNSPTGGPLAISMPSVPIGNNGTDRKCVWVKWLGNSIPRGDVVTVTSVKVEPPFTFDPTVTNCGAPSCANYHFSAANDSGQNCYIGVGYMHGSIDPDGFDRNGRLELSGHLRCPSNINAAACQRDAVTMQRPGIGTVRFSTPTIDKTSPPPSPSPSPQSPTSSPPESPSSSPATPISSPPTTPTSP
jgi:hypothetical protein